MPRLDHVTIHSRDTRTMISFLETVLGVKEGKRPPFSNPGHWLYLDSHPVVHIDLVERDDNFPPGMINHCAFALYDFEPAVERIKSTGYRFEHRDIPDTELGQIFVYGPEGLKIELQYRRSNGSIR